MEKKASQKKDGEEQLGILTRKRSRKGPAERMWAPIKLNLNENYKYVTNNFGLKFLYYIAIIFGMPFVYLFFKIRYCFKITGRANARIVKKRSAVTVSNHVHNMDSFMITNVFYPNTPYFVALKHNFEAFLLGGLVRVLRGIPLPEDIKSFGKFSEQIGDVLRHTKCKIHIFPEGEIAPYSRELRSFKNGAFHLAAKNGAPVLPMAFVFPGKKRIELLIGKPIYVEDIPGTADMSLPKKIVMMSDYTRETMQGMIDEYYKSRNIDVKEPAK